MSSATIVTYVLATLASAQVVEATREMPALPASASIDCGKLNPSLDVLVRTQGDERQFSLDKEFALGADALTDAVQSGRNGWRGRAEFSATCAQTPGTGVDVQLKFDVVRRGGCGPMFGGCATASPQWRSVASLPRPGAIRVKLSREGGALPLTCSVRIGPILEQSVLAPLPEYSFQPFRVPAGQYEIWVGCPRAAKACKMLSTEPLCSENGVVKRDEAKLRIAVRIDLDK